MLGNFFVFFTVFCVVCALDEFARISKTYYGPSFENYMLDWCRVWETECGKPAADEFCKSKGFRNSTGFKILPKAGDFGIQTKTIHDGRVCITGTNHGVCDGFSYITCTNGLLIPTWLWPASKWLDSDFMKFFFQKFGSVLLSSMSDYKLKNKNKLFVYTFLNNVLFISQILQNFYIVSVSKHIYQ